MDEQDWDLALGEVMGWTRDRAYPWVGTTSVSWTCLQNQMGGVIPPTRLAVLSSLELGSQFETFLSVETVTPLTPSLLILCSTPPRFLLDGKHSGELQSWPLLAIHFLSHLYFPSPSFSPSKEWIVCPCESEVAQMCPILCDPVDCSVPGSSIHVILHARIVKWVAISFSRGSSQRRDRTHLPHCRQTF